MFAVPFLPTLQTERLPDIPEEKDIHKEAGQQVQASIESIGDLRQLPYGFAGTVASAQEVLMERKHAF